jgi:hypothetical protein
MLTWHIIIKKVESGSLPVVIIRGHFRSDLVDVKLRILHRVDRVDRATELPVQASNLNLTAGQTPINRKNGCYKIADLTLETVEVEEASETRSSSSCCLNRCAIPTRATI